MVQRRNGTHGKRCRLTCYILFSLDKHVLNVLNTVGISPGSPPRCTLGKLPGRVSAAQEISLQRVKVQSRGGPKLGCKSRSTACWG